MAIFTLPKIEYIERTTGKIEIEAVFGERSLAFLYGNHRLGAPLAALLSRLPSFSRLYGWLQRRPKSQKKVAPFIKTYGVNPTDFAKPTFDSFDDFFTRKLKPEARPIAGGPLICPADGRYWACQDASQSDGFLIKGKKYSLSALLQDEKLAERYANGPLVMARLCPTDYHRFHFPADGKASRSEPIKGRLYSVNPQALFHKISTYTENKRALTRLETETMGTILIFEVGATCVGTIHQTYSPGPVKKGDEKGYFSFGGSAMILLFEPGKVTLADDLLTNSARFYETRCLMGQHLSS